MRARVCVLVVWLTLTTGLPPLAQSSEAEAPKPSSAPGKAIYRDGILPDGSALSGRIVNDVQISGEMAACANCHKRSGLGSNEGETFAPPVAGDILFAEQRLKAHRLSPDPAKGSSALDRPAYTRETLFKALTTGLSNTGQVLEAIMPRYTISDAHYQHLYAYLKTLSASDDPGVTRDAIHIATIVDDEASEASAAFMLEILERYIDTLNAGTRHETRRARFAPIQKEWPYQSYRKYVLHAWRVSGDPGGWGSQLEAQYRQTPVFAIVSGISDRSWKPVHDFCNHNEIPCVFPGTPLPVTEGENHYTLYFSRGLSSEAKILAGYINANPDRFAAGAIVQLYDASEYGRSGVSLLQRSLNQELQKQVVNIGLDETPAHQLAGTLADAALVIYWGRFVGGGIEDSLIRLRQDTTVFVPYALARSRAFNDSVKTFEVDLYTAYPFVDPANEQRHLIRPLSWLRANGIENRDNLVLANTFTAMLLFKDAVMHVRSNFNRDYVLEILEHSVDNAVVTSLYPRLSLGPGQRYASRGGAIMKLTGDPTLPLEPVTGWTIPAE